MAMTTLVSIELTCPVCATRFTSQRIVSMHSIGQDTDFRPHSGGVDPQPHYVHACPKCMFAAFELDYQTLQDPVREFVMRLGHRPDQVLLDQDRIDLSGSTKYLLAARCYSHDSRASDLRLADLYLRASWCARQENLVEREHEAQCQAALLFEKALEVGEVADDQLKTILYLLGELYRRVGRYELATALFDKAFAILGEDDSEDSDERLALLIQRQRAAATVGSCENMVIEAG